MTGLFPEILGTSCMALHALHLDDMHGDMQIWWGTIFCFVLVEVVWPCLTLPATIWTRGYFKFQVVLGFFIAITSAIIAIFLPLWEGREEFMALFNWMLGRKERSRGKHSAAAFPA